MTINPLHVMTQKELNMRDWRTALLTLAAVASIGYAAHTATVAADEPEPPAIVTGDALRVAAYVCRRNDGVRTIEPVAGKVRFVCRDGAVFEDIVVSLK